MKKPYSEYTQEELDSLMDRKWEKLRKKYPTWNTGYMIASHELLDWYEEVSKDRLLTI